MKAPVFCMYLTIILLLMAYDIYHNNYSVKIGHLENFQYYNIAIHIYNTSLDLLIL